MTTPYEAPKPAPARVRENRVAPASGSRTLAIWVVVIVVFVALYRLAQPSKPLPAPAMTSDPAENRPIPLWPLALPLATAAAFALLFRRVRARLPAKYRTMELRTEPLVAPPLEEPPPPPSMTPIELAGKSGDRNVTLRIEDAGLHWSVPKSLLRGAEELEILWSEVEHVAATELSNSLQVWVIMIAIFGGLYSWNARSAAMGAGSFVVGAVALVLGRRLKGSGGQLTLVTKTHQLALVSKALDRTTLDAILAAVRARRPSAVPAPTASQGCLSVPWLTVLKPLADLRYVWAPPEAIVAEVPAVTFNDDETRAAFVEQRRLHALWMGGLTGGLPISVAAAAALMAPLSLLPIAIWFGAWIAGLIASTRWMPLLARLSGMTLRR